MPAPASPDRTAPGRDDPDAAGQALLNSGFGASMLLEEAPLPARAGPRSAVAGEVFDVCHVGMVLRTVLFVEGVLLLGVMFVAPGPEAGLLQLALASGVALPGVVVWLAVACAARQRLAPLGTVAQWQVAALLGALGGGFGWALMQFAGRGLVGLGPWFAPVLSGAFLGVLLTLWLQLRNRSQLPADTTARLAELQSRIRPHFLFNTLNSALGLVRRDPVRAEALLEDLAELFRVALADGASVVSLGDEIELAQRYLAIEQIRFGDRLQVVWQLDPAAAGARLPPLLLQPLVENAVRHGVEPCASGGVIRIRTRVKAGMAWVSIANTLPEGPGGPVPAGHGIALQNVRERLRLMHDVAARFETQADAETFRVQLALPL